MLKIFIIVMLLLVWRFLCWHNANISWCLGIFVGNTFATTTMISYGTFLSYGALYIPSFGIMKAYVTVDPTLKELQNAIGFFLIAWAIFSFSCFYVL